MTDVESDFPCDVFLSHSAKDKAIVRAVPVRLRTDRVKVWPVSPKQRSVGGFDEWVLQPGDSIEKNRRERWTCAA